MPCQTPYRGDTSQMLLYKIASCLEASGVGGGGVTSFNGFTGAILGVSSFNSQIGDVVLTLADISTLVDGRYVLKAGDTMTGALAMPAGTAALPSNTFSGDLDTGIYHPAANTVGLSAGGGLILAVSTTGVNLTTALAYQYNAVNVIRAQTALGNYFFGPSGNLTMTGTDNVAVGAAALLANTTGTNNLGVGTSALQRNLAGNENTALGYQALAFNTSGSFNMAVGSYALGSNTTASNGVAIGYQALYSNTTGSSNVGIGLEAGRNNISGSFNVAIGIQALKVNTVSSNTAIGSFSLLACSTGSENSGLGRNSLLNLTTGSMNTAVGYNTGLGITTGGNNTILGANVTGLAAALTNNIIIADGSGNQRITVANTGVVTIPIALTLATAAPLSMASGANQRAGNAVLVGGTVTVANTTVTANTLVIVTRKTAGGTIGFAVTYTVIAATSFTLTSDNVLDTSTYSYVLIENP